VCVGDLAQVLAGGYSSLDLGHITGRRHGGIPSDGELTRRIAAQRHPGDLFSSRPYLAGPGLRRGRPAQSTFYASSRNDHPESTRGL
jgi:hypothetical protein